MKAVSVPRAAVCVNDTAHCRWYVLYSSQCRKTDARAKSHPVLGGMIIYNALPCSSGEQRQNQYGPAAKAHPPFRAQSWIVYWIGSVWSHGHITGIALQTTHWLVHLLLLCTTNWPAVWWVRRTNQLCHSKHIYVCIYVQPLGNRLII